MAKESSSNPVALGPIVDPVQVYHPDQFKVIQDEIELDISTFDLRTPGRAVSPSKADPQANDPTATPFDLNAKAMSRPAGHGVKVTIKLPQNEDIYFRTDKYYITAGNTYSKSHLRRDSGHPTSGEPKTATFYVRQHPTNKYVSYNLGLIVKEGQWELPIYVDPKIENNG